MARIIYLFTINFNYRTSGNYSSDEDNSCDDREAHEDGDDLSTQDSNVPTQDEESSEGPAPKKRRISKTGRKAPEYSTLSDQVIEYLRRKEEREAKTQETETAKNKEDPDVAFLMSLLGEIRAMTPNQKRRFKIKVWKSIEEVQVPQQTVTSQRPNSEYGNTEIDNAIPNQEPSSTNFNNYLQYLNM